MSDLIRKSDALAAAKGFIGAETAIAALPAVTVGVKPLVWCDLHKDGSTFVPRHDENPFEFPATISLRPSGHFRYAGRLYYTLDAAKAAAQADYTARILAALEPVAAPNLKRIGTGIYETQPAPDPAAIREAALREAEKALRDWQDDLNANRFSETAITIGMAADVVLALIAKGAADDRA